MTEELKLVIEAVDNGSTKTVGDLRKSITTMRDALVDANKESEEYQKIINTIGTAQAKIAGVMDTTRNVIKYQTGSYYELNQELVRLRKEYKSLSEEERNNPLIGGAQLTRIQELDGKLKDLDATMGQYQRNVGHYQLALEALNKSYANSKQELAAMKTAMDNLDPSSKEYEEAFQRAAQITHDLAQRQEMLKYSSQDLGDQLSNIRGIASNLAAGFSAINAVMGLVGSESEDVQKAMLKVQQAMALVQGLQGIDGLIKRTQGLSNAIKGWISQSRLATTQTTAQAKASTAAAAATNAETVAVKGATIAQKALNAAMKASVIGIIVTALTAIVALLGKGLKPLLDWVSGTKAAKDATDALKKSTEELNKTIEENNATMDFQSRLMEAQGKSYDEVYNYKRAQITANLELAKSELSEAEATAAAIGAKKLAKSKYDDFNESLKEQRKLVNELTNELTKLDQEREIHNAQEQTNKNKGSDSQLKSAQTLYKQLQDYYKTDRQKLAETYEENKKTIDKYIKDKTKKNQALLLLEQKYYDDLKKLTKDNMDAIYSIYIGQENRRLDLMDVWGDKYLERVLVVLDEEEKIAIADAKKKVGFQEKTDAEIAKMDKASQEEYKNRLKLFNNEKYLIEREYSMKRAKQVEEDNQRQIDEQRKLLEVKKYQVSSEEDLLKVEIELAEYDYKMIEQNRKLGESDAEYALRLNQAAQAVENLKEKEEDLIRSREQKKYDNDAEQARLENGDQSMQYLQARIKSARYYYENLRQMQGESDEDFRDRSIQALSDLVSTENDLLNQRLNNWRGLLSGIGDIMGTLADYYQTEIEAQMEADGQYNAESKKKFEWIKGLQIAQATINTISGAIAAFMGCQELGQPWGLVLGATQAAAVTAAGMAQIAKIKSTKIGGSGGSGGSGISATATPSYEPYRPTYTENVTGASDTENLRNAIMEQPIYVRVSDIDKAQKGRQTKVSESSF